MPSSPCRPVAAVGLVAAALCYVGCSRSGQSDGPGVAVAAPSAVPAPAPDATPSPPVADHQPRPDPSAQPAKAVPRVIADWSDHAPAGVLLISGEQDGYLQPCGCTEGQLGGLGRRYDLVEQMRGRGWAVAAIDLGNLIYKPAASRGGMEEEKIKFDTTLQALAAMKYDAVALGVEDMKMGTQELAGKLLNLQAPKFLSANLKPTAGFEEVVRPLLVTQAGPIRIGVTAVVDPSQFDALADAQKGDFFAVEAPGAVLATTLADLEKQSSVQVLMVQGPPALAKELAARFPGFDLVVSTAEYPDPADKPVLVNDGRTQIIQVGTKGKYVGVVGFFPDAQPGATVQYRRQALDQRGLREAERMRALVDDEMQQVFRAVDLVANYPRRPNGAAPVGAKYVGAESCQACHPNTFAKWASTKHARAYDALTNARRNREADADCVSCHTTGFGDDSGWKSTSATAFLKGNQCENCHGPASLHAAEPDNLAYRKPMVLTAEVAERTNFCTRCHDEDNDPHFQFAARYAQIYHKGLDTYDDPKVHRGRPAKVADRAP